MQMLNYRFRVMQKLPTGERLSMPETLSCLGFGRPPELAFFEDPRTWAALQQAAPGVQALLGEAGFEAMPAGGVLPKGWMASDKGGYSALKGRIREGLNRYDLMERPDDAFQLEDFLQALADMRPGAVAPVQHHLPEEFQMGAGAMLPPPGAGKDPGRESRTKWVVIMIGVLGAMCWGGYWVAEQMFGYSSVASTEINSDMERSAQILERLGVENFEETLAEIEADVAEAEAAAAREPEARAIENSPTVQRMRDSLEALRNR